MPVLFLFSALFCIPPLLSLRACLERLRYLRRQERGVAAALAGVAFSAISLAINIVVIGNSAVALASDDWDLGRPHALAAVLAWLCLWIWLFLFIMLRRKRRKAVL